MIVYFRESICYLKQYTIGLNIILIDTDILTENTKYPRSYHKPNFTVNDNIKHTESVKTIKRLTLAIGVKRVASLASVIK